jgi:hypothetical protein
MLYTFLNSEDLESAIKSEQLTQLTRDNFYLVALAESSAVSWMKDYLGQRFDMVATFPTIGEWAAGNDYGPAMPITIGGEASPYPCQPAWATSFYERPQPSLAGTTYTPLYAYNAAGRLTNYAWHEDQCYEALKPSLGVEPGNTTANPDWGLSWRLRDPRDPKLVAFCIDVTLFNLFKRITPSKIPEMRVSLYNQAKEWLTLVRDGMLTPDLPQPIKVADSSDAIRWDSRPPGQHYY